MRCPAVSSVSSASSVDPCSLCLRASLRELCGMRIAIDARKLHDFGIGTYIRNVLLGLARLDHETEYIVLCRPADVDAASELGAELPRGRRERAAVFARRAVPDSAQPGARARASAARAALRPAAGDALPHGRDDSRLHSPDVSAVPARVAGARLRARVDVERGPQVGSHPDRLGGVEARHPPLLRHPAREGRRSSTTRSTSASWQPPDEERIDRMRQRYQLDHPFLLYVGNIKPHKNLERLIDAFGRARAGGLDDLRLVIIGDEISKYPPLRQAVHRHRLDKYVRFLGFQPLRHAGGRSIAWRAPSCSRRSTRASGCRRSRRWRAARRSSRRTCRRCRRSPAARRCWSIRTTRRRSPTGITRAR